MRGRPPVCHGLPSAVISIDSPSQATRGIGGMEVEVRRNVRVSQCENDFGQPAHTRRRLEMAHIRLSRPHIKRSCCWSVLRHHSPQSLDLDGDRPEAFLWPWAST